MWTTTDSDSPTSLISAFAPPLTSTPSAKDKFYSNLNVVIKNIPNNEDPHQDSWPSCLGSLGVDKVNDNGERLLEFCSYHGLSVTNNFLQTKSHAQNTGTSLTWSSSGTHALSMCFLPAPVTGQTVTQTTLLYAARSAWHQRHFTALSLKGSLASTPTRCNKKQRWRNLQRPSKPSPQKILKVQHHTPGFTYESALLKQH